MSSNDRLFYRIRQMQESGAEIEEINKSLWDEFGTECAVLIADSSGFTKTTKEKGIVYYLNCLVKMRYLMGPIFLKHNCLSYRAESDNLYAEFSSVSDALSSAAEAVKILNEKKIETYNGSWLQLCTGIGYGSVLQSVHEGVFGDEVNLASKLGEDHAGEGEILLTESAYNNLEEKGKMNFEKNSFTIKDLEVDYYKLNK